MFSHILKYFVYKTCPNKDNLKRKCTFVFKKSLTFMIWFDLIWFDLIWFDLIWDMSCPWNVLDFCFPFWFGYIFILIYGFNWLIICKILGLCWERCVWPPSRQEMGPEIRHQRSMHCSTSGPDYYGETCGWTQTKRYLRTHGPRWWLNTNRSLQSEYSFRESKVQFKCIALINH